MADIYEELRQKRAKLDAQSMLAGIPDFDMNQPQAAPQPAAQAPSNTSTKTGSTSTGLLSDIGKGVVKGVAQGGMHLLNAVDDAGNWLNDNVVNLRTASQQKQYEELKAKNTKVGTEVLQGTVDAWNTGTTANQVSADISEFLLGFIPALRTEKALTGGVAAGAGIKSATSMGGKLAVTAADGAAAGAIASATTVNPEAANLSSLIETHAPSLSNPITRYLQIQGDEGDGEKRLKQALDSVLSGIVAAPVIEGLGAAIRGFKGKKIADGVDPAAEFQAAREATPQAAAEATQEAAPQSALDIVKGRLEDRSLFQKIRNNPNLGPEAVGDILQQYKIAGNPTLDARMRQDATDKLVEFFRTLDNEPNWVPGKADAMPTQGVPAVAKGGELSPVGRKTDGVIEGEATRIAGDLPNKPMTYLPAPKVRSLANPQKVAYQKEAQAAYEQEFQDLVKAEQLGADEAQLQAMHKSLLEKEAHLREINEIIAENQKAATAGKRGKVLDDTLAGLGDGRNPNRAFDKALRKEGFNDLNFTQAERDKIDRWLELKGAVDDGYAPLKSAPNEMDAGAMGIKEKRNTHVASAKLSQEIDTTLAALEGKANVNQIEIPADSELARLIPEGASVTREELSGFKEAMKSQAGFVDPTMLAKLYFGGSIREFGSGVLGGIAGYNSQDDNAPLRDKLMMAALGYLGGRAVYRMRGTKEIEQIRRENPTVSVLATRPGMEGIAPKEFHPRKSITIDKDRMQIFADRIKGGDFTKMTAEDTAELQAHIRNIDTAEDIEQLLTLTMQSFEKDFNKASVGSIGDTATGTRTWTQADDASRKINQGIKTVNDLFGDTKYLDARFKAAQVVIASSSQEVLSAAKILREVQAQQYVSGEEAAAALDAAALALDKAVKTHTTLVAKVEGAKSEIARGLRVMASKTSTEAELAGQLGALVQSIGGREGQLKMAEALRGLTDPRQVNAALNKGFLSRATEAALYVRLTGILWSPITQSKNILGNAMRTITTPMESLLEAGIAGVRGTEGGKTLGEVKSEAFGLLQGLQDAVSYLWNEKKFGEGWYKQIAGDNGFLVHDGATKAGDARMFDNNALGNLIQNPTSKSGQYLQMGLDRLGSAMGANLHFMGATDKFFQALNFRMSLNAQAYRAAMAEGLEAGSEEFLTHVAKTIDMPSMEITEKAMNAARESTFQQSLDQGGWLDLAGNQANMARTQIPMLNILVPFVKTPTNILKYVGSRTPLLSATPLSRQYSAVLATIKEGGPEADKILSQWAFGSMMLASAATLAYQGVLIGGQDGFRDQTQSIQNGQNYALKIGNQTIKIDGLDPIGMFFGMAADFVGALKRNDEAGATELAAVGMMSVLKYMGEKAYMQGLFDFGALVTEVIKSDDGKAMDKIDRYVAQTGTSFMPFGGASQWAAKQLDPTTKSYWDWKDRWLAKIPLASEAVPSKRNVLTGEVIKSEGALGPDALSPLTSKTLDESPAVKEIVRLGINVDYPDKNLDHRIGLTPKQYDRLQVLATQEVKLMGMTLKQHLDTVVSSPRWEQYPDGQEGYARLNNTKESIIKGIIAKYRDRAEKMLIQEDPELKALKFQDVMNKRNARKGLPIEPIAKN